MSELSDVLIIGSGPAGVHAALALIEAGRTVTMLDGGHSAPPILAKEEHRDFPTIRREDADQWKLFLGEDFSNIPLGGTEGGHGGGMAGGNRAYVTRGTTEHLPTKTENGYLIQSLAQGGLGAAWGAACAYLSNDDLEAMGLPAHEMKKHEDAITNMIGISGPGSREHLQPAVPPDHHAAAMLKQAEAHTDTLKKLNVDVMQPCTAVLTQDKDGRMATKLQDLDYYSDPGRSVYRPQFTLEKLLNNPKFRYVPGIIVDRIEETPEGCVVFGHAMGDSTTQRWSSRKTIVAAGAVNTARILLRSFDLFDTPVPLITKPHVFIPCLHWKMLGKAGPDKRLSLCQLLAIDRTKALHGLESACAQLYSFRSLLNVRLLPSVPLPIPQAMGLLSLLSPALIVADVRFPGLIQREQTMSLSRDGVLHINGKPGRSDAEKQSLKRIRKALKTIGLLPLPTIDSLPGSSSHYAGTVPVSNDTTLPLSTSPDGHVRQSKNIYVADAAMFRMLSPLPHTFTIMANARRIGQVVAATL